MTSAVPDPRPELTGEDLAARGLREAEEEAGAYLRFPPDLIERLIEGDSDDQRGS